LTARSLREGIEWTGREVIAWGGGTSDEAFADGAAYNPATDTWRPLAPSLLAARFAPATWTDKEVVFWAGEDFMQVFADGAAYDPATDRWRPLSPAPLSRRIVSAQVWTGTEVLFWGGSPGTYNNFFADGAAYNPSTNTWRPLPTLSGRLTDGVWTGKELLIWGGTVPRSGGGQQAPVESTSEGFRLTP
jgi:hypothetical protein